MKMKMTSSTSARRVLFLAHAYEFESTRIQINLALNCECCTSRLDWGSLSVFTPPVRCELFLYLNCCACSHVVHSIDRWGEHCHHVSLWLLSVHQATKKSITSAGIGVRSAWGAEEHTRNQSARSICAFSLFLCLSASRVSDFVWHMWVQIESERERKACEANSLL